MAEDTRADEALGATREALLRSRLERYVRLDRANLPYLAWQLEQFRPWLGQRILEIGCGVGGIVEMLGARERIFGIDVDPDVLGYAARRFRDRPECAFAVGDLGRLPRDLEEALRSERFDSIVCINVLEHVRDDIGALLTLERLLAPGGTLALLVPAHLWLYGRYDRLDGHYRRYTKAYLRTILGHTGLRPIRMYHFNAPGALGWWVQYRLLQRTVHDQSHFGAMNRILPFVRAAERLVRPPFGLSLVAVCTRDGESP
jgi:SAM-dependent methyltransferase